MQLVYHHHTGTGVCLRRMKLIFLQHTSPALVSLLLDTGHAVFADIDPLDLTKHSNALNTYLKDIRRFCKELKQKPGILWMQYAWHFGARWLHDIFPVLLQRSKNNTTQVGC